MHNHLSKESFLYELARCTEGKATISPVRTKIRSLKTGYVGSIASEPTDKNKDVGGDLMNTLQKLAESK